MTAHEALEKIERSLGSHGWFSSEETDAIQKALNELEELKKEVVQRQETEDSFTAWIGELTNTIDIYDNARCGVSNVLVDVSKSHQMPDKGIEEIRIIMSELYDKLQSEGTDAIQNPLKELKATRALLDYYRCEAFYDIDMGYSEALLKEVESLGLKAVDDAAHKRWEASRAYYTELDKLGIPR